MQMERKNDCRTNRTEKKVIFYHQGSSSDDKIISYTNKNDSLDFMCKKKGGENFAQTQTHNMH